MRLEFRNRFKSISTAVINEEIADFVVLSGPNGTGKSNLLEAIENGSIGVNGLPNPPGQEVRLFKLSGLMREAEPVQSPANYPDSWISLKQNIENYRYQFTNHPHSLPAGSAQLADQVLNNLVGNNGMLRPILEQMEAAAGKRLIDFRQRDFRLYSPLFLNQRDPFTMSISEVFLSYHGRRNRNDVALYMQSQGREDTEPLTQAEFVAAYGAPPWELLNETLKIVGLSNYSFNHPEGPEEGVSFQPVLTNSLTGEDVRVEDLSTGERTLLAVALTLYTGSEFGTTIQLPKVLLLDEADASLHPSMVTSLLRVVKDIFVEKYGVCVIMTTHSPTTVALAPEESLYIMHREGAERLTKAASRDQALNALTVGIPTLSVKLENRRQVLVESEVDAPCHDALYRYGKSFIKSDISLTFIASGKGSAGNCDAVKHLVDKFRKAGNDRVKGLIDRDARTEAPADIHFSDERYSLENHILDPLALGLYIIRERLLKPEQFGLDANFKYFEYDSHKQEIVNGLMTLIELQGDDLTEVPVKYADGSETILHKWYLESNGHVLQERLRNRIQSLNRHNGTALLKEVIDKVYKEFPVLIPEAYIQLYIELSS